MDIKQVKTHIEDYEKELEGIIGRFKKDHHGIHIDIEDNYRMRQITTELYDLISDHIPNSSRYARMVVDYYNDGISTYTGSCSLSGVKSIKGLVSSLRTRIERNPVLFSIENEQLTPSNKSKYEAIDILTNRFHLVVRQLRERYSNRSTLSVEDEYDVQDLFHSLLNLYFDDIRPEEWTPSYAGSSSRVDFLLPEIDTVIEIKKTRQSLTSKKLGDQLLIDIAKYKKHPQCRRLVCFVYDPEGRVSNPRGLETDLSNCDKEIDVQTIIVPKHA